jgi:hypothetical protein
MTYRVNQLPNLKLLVTYEGCIQYLAGLKEINSQSTVTA